MGDHLEDQRTGFGTMIYPDGAEFSGIWENGVHKEFRWMWWRCKNVFKLCVLKRFKGFPTIYYNSKSFTNILGNHNCTAWNYNTGSPNEEEEKKEEEGHQRKGQKVQILILIQCHVTMCFVPGDRGEHKQGRKGWRNRENRENNVKPNYKIQIQLGAVNY